MRGGTAFRRVRVPHLDRERGARLEAAGSFQIWEDLRLEESESGSESAPRGWGGGQASPSFLDHKNGPAGPRLAGSERGLWVFDQVVNA